MDMAVYTGGALRHTKIIPYAGNVVTKRHRMHLEHHLVMQKPLKSVSWVCSRFYRGKDETVEVPSVGGRPPRSLQRQTLAEVIEPRYTELLNLVNENFKFTGTVTPTRCQSTIWQLVSC